MPYATWTRSRRRTPHDGDRVTAQSQGSAGRRLELGQAAGECSGELRFEPAPCGLPVRKHHRPGRGVCPNQITSRAMATQRPLHGTNIEGERPIYGCGLRSTELRGLAGQDTAHEFGVGMAPLPQIDDNSISVERRTVMSDCHGIAIVFKKQPTGCPRRLWHPRAARIQRANAVNEAIGRGVSMPADDDIGIAPS